MNDKFQTEYKEMYKSGNKLFISDFNPDVTGSLV